MNQAEFLQDVHWHMKLLVEDGELGLAGYAWALGAFAKDGSQGIKVIAMDLEPRQAWELALIEALMPGTDQLVFCLDRYGKPDQGTLLGDLLAGFYYERGAPELFRPFIVEYTAKPEPRVLWFNWENPFWKKAITHELLGTIREVQARADAQPEERRK